ncbi:MAG: hypothetical protein Q9213_003275 [Squamulea squamosa]
MHHVLCHLLAQTLCKGRHVGFRFGCLHRGFITAYYYHIKDLLFHQNAFALLTAVVFFRNLYGMEISLRPSRQARRRAWLGRADVNNVAEQTRMDQRDLSILKTIYQMIPVGLGSIALGFLIWNVDNEFCPTLRRWRRAVGLPWGILLEGHGWWHIFTGIAQFFNLTWSIWLRYCFDGQQDQMVLAVQSLIDDIINTVNTIVYRAIEAIENGLFSIPPQQLGYSPDKDASGTTTSILNPDHPEAKDEIENGVHQLETLLEATVDKTFDKFEIYTLRNILTVPDGLAPWMRLGHYEGLTLPLASNSLSPESILALRRKVQETRKLNVALRNTHAKNAATISQLHSFLSPAAQPSPDNLTSPSSADPTSSLSFLTSHPGATTLGLSLTRPSSGKPDTTNSGTPLSTHTQSFISQLPALRQALEELKPRLKTLPEKIGDVDWESRREERRAYIEGRVRKVVGESNRGDDIVGAKIAREEVRDLEGVIGGMGAEKMEE